MKIVITVEAIPPYCGGGEQIAWMHAKALSALADVSVLTFGDADRVEAIDGITVYRLKKHPKQLLYYSTAGRKKINGILADLKPEIVHSHMPSVIHFCIEKKKFVLISTIHDGIPENKIRKLGNMPPFSWLKFKLLRICNIHKSDHITCVSRHNLKLMEYLYKNKKEKFHFIPNCIYEKYFLPVSNNTGTYLLNYGRQIDLKMGALIECARSLPNEHFKFIGSGPMVKDYGLNNVQFLGFMPDFIDWIDNSFACVFPSKSENFPLVGLEAMARGKPVIATETGFSEYIVDRKNGILLPDAIPERITAAIQELRTNNILYSEIRKNARITAMQYRIDKIARKYLNLYSQVLLGQSPVTVTKHHI